MHFRKGSDKSRVSVKNACMARNRGQYGGEACALLVIEVLFESGFLIKVLHDRIVKFLHSEATKVQGHVLHIE